MWPVLTVSFLLFTVVIERVIFLVREKTLTDPTVAAKMLEKIKQGDIPGAITIGRGSKDAVARVYTYALTHKESSLDDAYALAASGELERFGAGLPTLDTCITAAVAPDLIVRTGFFVTEKYPKIAFSGVQGTR